jgi:hypothetical protein
MGAAVEGRHGLWARLRIVLLATVMLVCVAPTCPALAAAPLRWSPPRLVDDAVPFGHTPWLSSIACLSATWCAAIDSQGRVATSTDPAGGAAAWTAASVDPFQLTAVSCPSELLCVAIDENGNVVTSTDPTGGAGAWRIASVDFGHLLPAISCPSTTLCVAVDDYGDVVSSTDPTGGRAAWSAPTSIDPSGGILALSCPSVSLCVGVDAFGRVVSSTDPAGGAGTWKLVDADGDNDIVGVSCPSTRLCVAIDESGNVLSSTDPTGDASAWTVAPLDAPNQLGGVACVSQTLCVVDDRKGNVLTSTDPASGVWSAPVAVDSYGGLSAISCATTGFCAAADAYGHLVTTSDPAGGASAWVLTVAEDGADSLALMSCPSISLCVAVDDAGRIATSTDPAASTWEVPSTATLGGTWPLGLSCPAVSLCVALGQVNNTIQFHEFPDVVATSTDPAAGPSGWASSSPFDDANGLSCASVRLCASAVGSLVTSTTPTVGSSWRSTVVSQGLSGFYNIFCDSQYLCVATDPFNPFSGEIFTSTDPTGGPSAWKATYIDPAHPIVGGVGSQASIDDVACPTDTLCVATDDGGNILWSTDPTGGARAWHLVHLNLGYPLGRSAEGSADQIECPSVAECIAFSSYFGEVVSATHPTGGASAWTVTEADPGADLTSLSCPSASLCIAGDANGHVVVGTGPGPKGVTRKTALAALSAAVPHVCARRHIATILRRGGCPTVFHAPDAGQFTVTWLGRNGEILASGQAEATGIGKLTVHVPLTDTGKRLLRQIHRDIHIRIKATFLDAAWHVYQKTTKVTLTR